MVVETLPALVAEIEGKIASFISYRDYDKDSLLIVALGVTPEFQGLGIGKALVKSLENKAKVLHRKRLRVSTSNDDLPALAFYQRLGFQIFKIKPNVIAEKHGALFEGFGGIPIRHELRLEKKLTEQNKRIL